MPIRRQGRSWYWGSRGPFKSKKRARAAARAAYASGYRPKRQRKK